MCWSFLMVALLESVDDNVKDVARRLRTAKSKRDEQEDNTTDEIDTESREWKDTQQALSFSKIWSSNRWAQIALQDAIDYGNSNRARDPVQLETSIDIDSEEFKTLLKSFNESILPVLRSRGWLEETATVGNRVKKVFLPVNGRVVSYI